MHRRLRRDLAARRSPHAPRACPSTSRRSSAPTAASSSSPTTATRSTATPATSRRPTPTARAWAASGSWSSPAGSSSRPPAGRKSSYGYDRYCFMPYSVNAIFAEWPPPPSCAPPADARTSPRRSSRERAGLSQAEVARLERAGSNPTAAHARTPAASHRLPARARGASTPSTRPSCANGSTLTPAERLAAFEASQRNLDAPDPRGAPCRHPRALSSIPPACSAHWSTRRVDFVVIGGVAAVLHGSARNTFDLDICFASDPAQPRSSRLRA